MKSKDNAKKPSAKALRDARKLVASANGVLGGKARREALSPSRRSEIARMGAYAKSAKFKALNGDKK